MYRVLSGRQTDHQSGKIVALCDEGQNRVEGYVKKSTAKVSASLMAIENL